MAPPPPGWSAIYPILQVQGQKVVITPHIYPCVSSYPTSAAPYHILPGSRPNFIVTFSNFSHSCTFFVAARTADILVNPHTCDLMPYYVPDENRIFWIWGQDCPQLLPFLNILHNELHVEGYLQYMSGELLQHGKHHTPVLKLV